MRVRASSARPTQLPSGVIGSTQHSECCSRGSWPWRATKVSAARGIKDKIIRLLEEGKSYKEISRSVGCSTATISYHSTKHFGFKRDPNSAKRYDWEEIAEYYDTHSYKQTREKFGFAKRSWDDACKRGDITSRGYADITIPLEEILVENSSYNRGNLKKRLLLEGLLDNECYECGLSDTWNGKPITLHIDHINGVNNDNRLSNLRMLCPNCHSQTDTYSGKNAYKKDELGSSLEVERGALNS